jgi:hypothetical protein
MEEFSMEEFKEFVERFGRLFSRAELRPSLREALAIPEDN